jgi:carbon storage regulator
MLILTRRVDERIIIGDNVIVCVLEIEGNRVKLGLEAPKDIAILREEIHEQYAGSAANQSLLAGSSDKTRSA